MYKTSGILYWIEKNKCFETMKAYNVWFFPVKQILNNSFQFSSQLHCLQEEIQHTIRLSTWNKINFEVAFLFISVVC